MDRDEIKVCCTLCGKDISIDEAHAGNDDDWVYCNECWGKMPTINEDQEDR